MIISHIEPFAITVIGVIFGPKWLCSDVKVRWSLIEKNFMVPLSIHMFVDDICSVDKRKYKETTIHWNQTVKVKRS